MDSSGVNVRDAQTLANELDFGFIKDLKAFGESINARDINVAKTDNSFVVQNFESQQKAINQILDEGKKQQEAQKQSQRFRAAKSNADAIRIDNNDKKG